MTHDQLVRSILVPPLTVLFVAVLRWGWRKLPHVKQKPYAGFVGLFWLLSQWAKSLSVATFGNRRDLARSTPAPDRIKAVEAIWASKARDDEARATRALAALESLCTQIQRTLPPQSKSELGIRIV